VITAGVDLAAMPDRTAPAVISWTASLGSGLQKHYVDRDAFG
jgi:hypothetical protein